MRRPQTGPLCLIGGKSRLAKQIIALFPEHRTYVEAFAGGAQVFFRKKPSRVEVLNDLDNEIVNFFRVCQHHHSELVKQMRWVMNSRKFYQWMQKTDPETLTDIQRAARFFFLQKASFGGLRVHQSYAYGVTKRRPLNPRRIAKIIEKAYQRLQLVQIECLPYHEALKRYDRPTTRFYLDPPYWKLPYYRYNLDPKDFEVMAIRLARLKGRFILSINDRPEVRRIFSAFSIRVIETAYTASLGTAGKRYRELLIMNFDADQLATRLGT